ncbi:uncharacterized protein BJ171DRAFT_204092 [Polychytrium aggregatum]|uniref:uncharacterized protein n=1 Tax=Polychytrium aggregatum TaxID=110093 RepID=UPI0022FDCFF9|nr:uncharacterized protein BJ171DRAFT_204092 [Polychytrium aggregatum]KAI9199551.1 hypothetical protein BJ171DRAFT_204092 [Polychytrium aggregatum]
MANQGSICSDPVSGDCSNGPPALADHSAFELDYDSCNLRLLHSHGYPCPPNIASVIAAPSTAVGVDTKRLCFVAEQLWNPSLPTKLIRLPTITLNSHAIEGLEGGSEGLTFAEARHRTFMRNLERCISRGSKAMATQDLKLFGDENDSLPAIPQTINSTTKDPHHPEHSWSSIQNQFSSISLTEEQRTYKQHGIPRTTAPVESEALRALRMPTLSTLAKRCRKFESGLRPTPGGSVVPKHTAAPAAGKRHRRWGALPAGQDGPRDIDDGDGNGGGDDDGDESEQQSAVSSSASLASRLPMLFGSRSMLFGSDEDQDSPGQDRKKAKDKLKREVRTLVAPSGGPGDSGSRRNISPNAGASAIREARTKLPALPLATPQSPEKPALKSKFDRAKKLGPLAAKDKGSDRAQAQVHVHIQVQAQILPAVMSTIPEVFSPKPPLQSLPLPNATRRKLAEKVRTSVAGPATTEQDIVAYFQIPPHERRASDLQKIWAVLKTFDAFESLSDKTIKQVCEVSFLARYNSSAVVFKEGDSPSAWYIVLQGRLKAFKLSEERLRDGGHDRDIAQANKPLAIFSFGQGFGDYAILKNTPRTATIMAMEDAVVMVVYRVDFDRIIKASKLGPQYEKINFLCRTPVLQLVPFQDRRQLCGLFASILKIREYSRGMSVLDEGQVITDLGFIMAGECEVFKTFLDDETQTRYQVKLGVLGPNDYLGEEPIVKNTPKDVRSSLAVRCSQDSKIAFVQIHSAREALWSYITKMQFIDDPNDQHQVLGKYLDSIDDLRLRQFRRRTMAGIARELSGDPNMDYGRWKKLAPLLSDAGHKSGCL